MDEAFYACLKNASAQIMCGGKNVLRLMPKRAHGIFTLSRVSRQQRPHRFADDMQQGVAEHGVLDAVSAI